MWLSYSSAITSISTKAPLGRVFTATAERAGNGSLKNVAYTSFIAAKLSMDMAQVDACLGENVGYVGERLACLLLYSALSELARCGVDGHLS